MSFESEAKFHEALGYLCERYAGFKAKDLKHVLGITCPDFMDGLFERKDFECDLRYIGDSSAKFTQGETYESMTFNGATYEVIDDIGNLTMIGSYYFECMDENTLFEEKEGKNIAISVLEMLRHELTEIEYHRYIKLLQYDVKNSTAEHVVFNGPNLLSANFVGTRYSEKIANLFEIKTGIKPNVTIGVKAADKSFR